MELSRLDKYKKKFREFSGSINSLQQYLSRHSVHRAGTTTAISAHDVSSVLNIRELDALFLLSLAEKEQLVHRVYKVFTEDDTFLGEFRNNLAIPQKLHNDSTGQMVDRDHVIVDLVFELEK